MQINTDLIGLNVQPDEWGFHFETLQKSDGFKDASFPGCDYRLPSSNYLTDHAYAVNITLSGRKSHDISTGHSWYKTRIKIEFVGDGDPSEFTHGWIYSPYALIS